VFGCDAHDCPAFSPLLAEDLSLCVDVADVAVEGLSLCVDVADALTEGADTVAAVDAEGLALTTLLKGFGSETVSFLGCCI
jgi:hypothetical protein